MGLIRKLGSKSAMAAARSAVKQVKAMGLERPHQRTQNLAVSYWVTMDFFIDSISSKKRIVRAVTNS